jgi:hypothetical protein
LPPNAGIGCFHAGIPLFFGSRQVVALDGLVNHRARMLRSEHRFEAFLRESLLDEMSAVTAYDHPLGVRLTGSYGCRIRGDYSCVECAPLERLAWIRPFTSLIAANARPAPVETADMFPA